jgi:pentatricopeptide repeat-containing protein PET309
MPELRCGARVSLLRAISVFHSTYTRLIPERDRVLMMKEVIPRRDRPFRRYPSHHLPHLTHRRALQHQRLLKFTTQHQQRHASFTTKPKARLRSNAKSYFLSCIDRLRKQLGDLDKIERAWFAYLEVVVHGALPLIAFVELLAFGQKLADVVEQFYGDKDDKASAVALRIWGERLCQLLKDIEHNITSSSSYPSGSPENHRWRCLLARAHVMNGDLDQATTLARTLNASDRKDYPAVGRAILLYAQQKRNAVSMLRFVVSEWPLLAPFLTAFPASPTNDLFTSIENPASVLSSLRRDWDEESRARAGQLLIKALCLRRLPEDAFTVFEEMRGQELAVPDELQLALVRALACAGIYRRANRLFAESSDAQPLTARLSTGLYLFSQQGDVERTDIYFKQLETITKRMPIPYHAMRMHAYALQGNTEQVISIFQDFFEPSGQKTISQKETNAFHMVLLAHARSGNVEGMNTWMETMARAGIPPDLYLYNILLKSFATRGDLSAVSFLLDQMRAADVKPNHISYTIVITLLAHRQDPVSAEAIYRRAIEEGVVPDRLMVTALMNAHVEAGSWKGVIRVFDYLTKSPARKLHLSLEVYNTLLKAYVLSGAPFKVVSQLFLKIEKANVASPDEYTFALLIQSACDSGKMDAAADILAEMERRVAHNHYDIRMSAYILTIMMAGYLRGGNQVKAKEIYDGMLQRGIKPTSGTYNAILKAYGNEGTQLGFQLAEEFIQRLVEGDTGQRQWDKSADTRSSAMEHIYRPLMVVYARLSRSQDVERLLENMFDAGGEPTPGVLTALLDAYRRTGNTEAVLQLWPHILQLALKFSEVKPLMKGEETNYAHLRQNNILCAALSIYMGALSAAGLHNEIGAAWTELQDHGFSFNSHNWNHLAVALVHAGEPERAFGVVEKVILPYQKRSQDVLVSRDSRPDTPLSFEVSPSVEEAIPEPTSEALRRMNERISVVRTANRRADDDVWLDIDKDLGDDLAQPLHILRQIAPSWHTWNPHERTLRVLLKVIWRLESGDIITPLRPGGEFENGPDRTDETMAQARAILGRIIKDYPETVRLVLDFEAQARRQMGRKLDKMYG